MAAALTAKDADAAALGVLVKMSARKRFSIRMIEVIVRPFVIGLEWLRRSRGNADREVRKILVMEYWNLGDIVMLSPFLRSLRVQYPNARITLLTSPKAAPLLENQALVDEVIVVRVPWAEHYSRLRKYNPFSTLWVKLLQTLKFLHAQQLDLAFTARAEAPALFEPMAKTFGARRETRDCSTAEFACYSGRGEICGTISRRTRYPRWGRPDRHSPRGAKRDAAVGRREFLGSCPAVTSAISGEDSVVSRTEPNLSCI